MYTLGICYIALTCYCLLELPSILIHLESKNICIKYIDRIRNFDKYSFIENKYNDIHLFINNISSLDRLISINYILITI